MKIWSISLSIMLNKNSQKCFWINYNNTYFILILPLILMLINFFNVYFLFVCEKLNNAINAINIYLFRNLFALVLMPIIDNLSYLLRRKICVCRIHNSVSFLSFDRTSLFAELLVDVNI